MVGNDLQGQLAALVGGRVVHARKFRCLVHQRQDEVCLVIVWSPLDDACLVNLDFTLKYAFQGLWRCVLDGMPQDKTPPLAAVDKSKNRRRSKSRARGWLPEEVIGRQQTLEHRKEIPACKIWAILSNPMPVSMFCLARGSRLPSCRRFDSMNTRL